MVVWESVPISVSGNANGRPPSLPRLDDAGQVLEVDLVDDPGVRRDDAEVVEGALAPAQERVALAVPLELALGVLEHGQAGAELVDLHGVVDDELGRDLRVDRRRIAAQGDHRLAHRGEVDDRGHAREVLEEDARRAERDLVLRLGLGVPLGDGTHLLGAAVAQRLRAEDVLEQDAKRVRKPRDIGLRAEGAEPCERVRRAAGDELLEDRVCSPPRLDSRLRRFAAAGLRPGTDARLPEPPRTQ